MPWEKSFDMDQAVDRATEVFWKKGYEGTSMSDLTRAMQINKGSLYNAFGSKQELFERALARYDQGNRAKRIAELREREDAVAAIRAFFDELIDESRRDPRQLGCFVVNTAQDLPNQPPAVEETIKTALNGIEAFFEDMIRKGQASGDIPPEVEPQTTAQGLLSMVVGLRLLSRGASDIRQLEAIRDNAMCLLRV